MRAVPVYTPVDDDVHIAPLSHDLEQLPFQATHLYGYGGAPQTHAELMKFTQVHGLLEDDAIAYGINEARNVLRSCYTDHFRVTWECALASKPRDKACGDPFFKYGNYGSVLDKYGIENLQREFEQCEARVRNMDWPIQMFSVFSKHDKYTMAKIREERFRTIQSSPLFLQMLMYRLLRRIELECKETVPEFGALGLTADRYHEVIGRYEMHTHSLGYDITGMDRAMPAQLIFRILGALDDFIGPALMGYIQTMIAYGPLVDTDGTVVDRSGGNPSGQLWTTMLNCLVNYAMNKAVEYRIGHTLEFRVVGDDAVVFFTNPSVIDAYKDAMDYVAYCCGFTMKWQTCVAVPGEGTIFLDTSTRVWETSTGALTTFACPSRVERVLPKLYQFVNPDRIQDIARGILDRLSPLYYWLEDNGYLEDNTAILWAVDRCAELGVHLRTREAVEECFILGRHPVSICDSED